MKCIAVMAGHPPFPDESQFRKVKGIQCVDGCRTHYWVYVPPRVPVGAIDDIRYRVRHLCRDEHHPNHPTHFEVEIPNVG
jgi:hypothetical protein